MLVRIEHFVVDSDRHVCFVCRRQLSTPQTAADGCFLKIWSHAPRITTHYPDRRSVPVSAH